MENKKQKLNLHSFQKSWMNECGFIQQKDRAVYVICREHIVCRTSSVQRHLKVFILPRVAELFIHKEKQRGCLQCSVFKNFGLR